MTEINQEKTKTNETFRHELERIDTNKITLIHNVADTYWGSDPKGDGRNLLGKCFMFIARGLNHTTQAAHSETRQEIQHAIPQVLLIGHSHMHEFDPEKLRGINVKKELAFNINEAQEKIRTTKETPDAVVYHLITNDIKDKSVEDCIAGMRKLVHDTKAKFNSELNKVLISLPPPVADEWMNAKISAVNSLLKPEFECIDHYHSFTRWGKRMQQMYKQDGIHLTLRGTKRLALNLKNHFTGI